MQERGPYDTEPRTEKVFTIPVSGTVRLYAPELAVLETPEMQRLGRIRQLGTAELVFRGASHTRLEHALGTVYEVNRMIAAIRDNPTNPNELTKQGERLARLFALLHDIGHVPFSHTLEDELHLLTRHDKNARRLQYFLLDKEASTLARRLAEVVDEEDLRILLALLGVEEASHIPRELAYVSDLVGNTVCADMLDYVRRDSHHSGLSCAVGDRFLNFFTLEEYLERDGKRQIRAALTMDRRGMPRPDVVSEVVKLLSYRYELAERVYFHHAKNAASVMLGRAVVAAGILTPGLEDDGDSRLWRVDDAQLLLALRDPRVAAAVGMIESSDMRSDLAERLGSDLRNRRLYKARWLAQRPALDDRMDDLAQYIDPVARIGFENELAAAADLPPGHVLLHLPPKDMLRKPAEVLVRPTASGRVVRMSEWEREHGGRATGLLRAHTNLWRVTVYVHRSATERQARLVRDRASDLLGAPSRYEPDRRPSGYRQRIASELGREKGWTVAEMEEALAVTGSWAGPDSSVSDLKQAMEVAVEAMRSASAPAPEPDAEAE